MIVEVKTVYVTPVGTATPSLEDIKEAQRIAAEENCLVELKWHVNYNGDHRRLIAKDSDPEYVYARLPKIYGM